jgi:tetratricopeptide (TPR) repeat protein
MTFDICVGTPCFGRVRVAMLCAVLASAAPTRAEKPREKLLAAKKAAYDTNFQNDEKGLRAAAEKLDALVTDRELAALALYYAGWTRWSLAAAQLQANEKDDAIRSLSRSVEDLRKAVALLPENAPSQSQAEFQCQLASSLISLAVVDGTKMSQILPEVMKLRKQAVELAPANPRVVMMDAGMIFNTPAQYGGSQEKGIERWLEAIRLFEAEKIEDPLQPDWGRALAYGWLASTYLRMTPPRTAEAKEMANHALALRPDFWFVKTQILPKVP